LTSCLAIAPVFLERDVFVTCPLRNHYFYSPLTDPFGARIRFRALLHEGNTRSSAFFWLHAWMCPRIHCNVCVFATRPLQNHYFRFSLTARFGARIRCRALLCAGTTRSSAVFWLHASESPPYSLTCVFLWNVPCQILLSLPADRSFWNQNSLGSAPP
jgi:hypothetical protein